MSSIEDNTLDTLDDLGEGMNTEPPPHVDSNKRTRNDMLSTSSTSSPDQHSSNKKPKSDLSVITGQTLSIIGEGHCTQGETNRGARR